MTRKHFLSIAFAVLYFNQKTVNDTPINHLLTGNIQDNINTIDGIQIDFFVKLYTRERPENIQSNPIHHSMKKSRFGKKNVKKGIPNRVIYMATSNFKN